MNGNCNRTLYVGNLHAAVSEELISVLFEKLGKVLSCKMFQEANSDPFCFVEFSEHAHALNAISMMNDKMLQDKKMRVDWATGQGNKGKVNRVDTTNHYHVYVGELSPEIDEHALREAFKVFGEISDCKVVKDPQTFKSRGYGFVVFIKENDAEESIQQMNGQWLGRKMIRARWATRKLGNNNSGSSPQDSKADQSGLDYAEIFSKTTGTNTTVFCGGLKQEVTEEVLQQAFHSYGDIDKIKIFKEKGYAFIKYTCKDHACCAIVARHNSEIQGQTIRCSWGKDTGPEGQHPPPATSPTMMVDPSGVTTPIPGAMLNGQGIAMPSVAGMPLGMQHMAAAVTGQPIVGSAAAQAAHIAQGSSSGAAGSPYYWQYHPAHAAAMAAVQQQQHAQQQQQHMAAVSAAHQQHHQQQQQHQHQQMMMASHSNHYHPYAQLAQREAASQSLQSYYAAAAAASSPAMMAQQGQQQQQHAAYQQQLAAASQAAAASGSASAGSAAAAQGGYVWMLPQGYQQ